MIIRLPNSLHSHQYACSRVFHYNRLLWDNARRMHHRAGVLLGPIGTLKIITWNTALAYLRVLRI